LQQAATVASQVLPLGVQWFWLLCLACCDQRCQARVSDWRVFARVPSPDDPLGRIWGRLHHGVDLRDDRLRVRHRLHHAMMLGMVSSRWVPAIQQFFV
jgi:hypothetical protein